MADDRPNESEGRAALHEHLVDKAVSARLRHGLLVDAEAIQRILRDPETVRYPVTLVFDAAPLEPGEFAYPQPRGDHPSQGFRLAIHPFFRTRPDVWAMLVAYHIPTINYGEVAGPAEAELFGSALVGMEREEYYRSLCELADALAAAGG